MPPHGSQRGELEAAFERVVQEVAADPRAAFQVTLEPDESLRTIRAAFARVRGRLGADAVSLVRVGEDLYVTSAPPARGRAAKSVT